MNKMKQRLKSRRAQGLTEYIIIVAIVAVLSIAIVMKFGNQIRDLFWSSGSRLAGESESSTEVQNRMDEQENAENQRSVSDL